MFHQLNPRFRTPGTIYLTGCTNPPTAAEARSNYRLGMLAQPGNSLHLQFQHYTTWAIDNGAFGKARRGTPWTDADTATYLSYLRRVVREVDHVRGVLFAVAPDVLTFVDGAPRGDAVATWQRSSKVFPQIRELGLPAAFVAQDGITAFDHPPIDWDAFDVLFLGGSDEMKLGREGRLITELAQKHGKWVHMGRVNSFKRFSYAVEIGCDSTDGTFIGYGPLKNLPKVVSWISRTSPFGGASLPAAA